jgi:parallel beta helix pectate lyase-like protein
MTRRSFLAPALAAALLAIAAAPAHADPAAGRVELRDATGALVGEPLSGPDAIQAAIARVGAGPLARVDPTAFWTIVVGAGTYGDFVVAQPSLVVRPAAGATVTIDGTGGTDDSDGSCLAIRRGGVIVSGLDCRNAPKRGIVVDPPPSEGAVVLQGVEVTRARSDGIAVIGGADVLIEDAVVTTAARDGISLSRLTGPGPYRVVGGSVKSSGDDGIDLANDAQRVLISGVTSQGNRGNGIESDDAGSVDLTIENASLVKNGTNGALLGGAGARLALLTSRVTGNAGYGVSIGSGSGFVLRGDSFDGTNAKGDLQFSQAARAGDTFDDLRFGATVLALPGEPSGVVLSALPSGFRTSRLPVGVSSLGRLVRVKDGGAARTSVVALRYVLPPALLSPYRLGALLVHEDDPPGNARVWQPLTNTRVDAIAGTIDVTLTDAQIASGSDARFATYGPLAPLNSAPQIGDVYPASGAVVSGRNLLVAAFASDDATLGTGSFALYIDGRRRGGVSYREGKVVFRQRLTLGLHRARLLVVDPSNLMAAREWSFTVRNVRPTVLLREAVPRPAARVRTRGPVTLVIPVSDDLPVSAGRVQLSIDGRRVRFRLLKGRVVARVVLEPGRHRALILVADVDGARVVRPLLFRTVRP